MDKSVRKVGGISDSDQKKSTARRIALAGKKLCSDRRAFRIVLFGRRLFSLLDGLNCATSFVLNFLCFCLQCLALIGFIKNNCLVRARCAH